jgi:5-methylcytosine-specific restriction endonuclease McrA
MVISYTEYLATPQWRAKALEAKQRAGWLCALCPSGEELETHHRTYARVGRERPEDLIVLCGRCHRRHHGTYDDCLQRQLMLPFVELPKAA